MCKGGLAGYAWETRLGHVNGNWSNRSEIGRVGPRFCVSKRKSLGMAKLPAGKHQPITGSYMRDNVAGGLYIPDEWATSLGLLCI